MPRMTFSVLRASAQQLPPGIFQCSQMIDVVNCRKSTFIVSCRNYQSPDLTLSAKYHVYVEMQKLSPSLCFFPSITSYFHFHFSGFNACRWFSSIFWRYSSVISLTIRAISAAGTFQARSRKYAVPSHSFFVFAINTIGFLRQTCFAHDHMTSVRYCLSGGRIIAGRRSHRQAMRGALSATCRSGSIGAPFRRLHCVLRMFH